jgi:simple sugar transport system permease protein
MMTVFIFRTRWGMSIRSIGDNPVAADSAGLPVRAIRAGCVALGGALCGLAGAYISLALTTMWQTDMTAGRGWIAVAMIIFAQWHPLKAMYSAYLFGAITALQFAMQVWGIRVSPHFLQMLPYIFTILVLSFAMIKARSRGASMEVSVGPASLGRPYTRELG